MKKFKIVAVLAIAFCFLLGTTAVYAADEETPPEPYVHQVTVSAGNGSFDAASEKGTSATIDVSAGKVVVKNKEGSTVSTSEFKTLPDGEAPAKSKYFVTGMKLAGHDNYEGSNYVFNGTVDIYGDAALASYKEKDTELVIAYGLKGNMVKYTVRYVDQNGAKLAEPETYYGEIDQKPVISYKYIEGYVPRELNATKTLTADPDVNIIEFTYVPVTTAEGQTIINNMGNANANAGGNAAGNAAAGNAGGNAAAAPGAATIGDNDTPMAINDQDTPLAANPDEEEGGGPGAFPFIIGGVIAAGIIAAIAAILARRKGEEGAE